jgi:hypothetical protein
VDDHTSRVLVVTQIYQALGKTILADYRRERRWGGSGITGNGWPAFERRSSVFFPAS